jgi:LDH2 family malate/lactate/ureidoglycolate dehydrogenase
MAPARIRLTVAEARRHSELALKGLGYDADEAAIIADHAIDAALCGYEYSGLAKLLNIPEHRRFKLPRRKMSILRETPVSTQFDGGSLSARSSSSGCERITIAASFHYHA